MGFPEHVRLLGAQLYKQCNFNAGEAGKKLISLVEGEGPTEPGQFCKRWWKHFEKNKHVKDKPRTGRPRKVPDSLAAEIAGEIVRNQGKLRNVLQQNPEIAQRVGALAVTKRTIERAVRRAAAEPSLIRRRSVRKKLTKQKKG